MFSNDNDDDDDCYYEYHHGTGKHILKRSDKNPSPKYSWKCICCHFIDVLIFVGCIAFLYFAIRYAFYCLENYGDGD